MQQDEFETASQAGGPGTLSPPKRSRPVRIAEACLLTLSGVTLAAMMLLVGVDIVGRHIASMPVTGAIELTEFAMGIAIFAALPSVALRNAHIRADLLSGNLGRRGRRVLEIASEIVGTLLFAALAWRLWIEGITVAGYGTTAGVLRLPLAPLTFYAYALCALSALTHLLRIFDRPSREHPS